MKITQKATVLAVIMLVIPLLMAFGLSENHQRWFQRKSKQIPPETISTQEHLEGLEIQIHFKAGNRHNHPLMAFWIEDMDGNYIQSLYVAESIAKGYFRHGDASTGRWQPGPLRRPAALPYWGHQRGIQAPDGYYIPTTETAMPDAVTGPTPKADFVLTTRTEKTDLRKFNLLMEINQSWDWNHYWHNNKFPNDEHYQTSSQPALVYSVTIDIDNPAPELRMQPIGHSHWSGQTGELFPDLGTITTALDIAREVTVSIQK